MKKTIIIIVLAAAAWLLLRKKTAADGTKEKSILGGLFDGVYSGSLLPGNLFASGTTGTTITSDSGRRTTSDSGRTQTPATGDGTTTGTAPDGSQTTTFAALTKPLTPFV